MTSIRRHLAMLAGFVVAGLAVASPVSRTASMLAVALVLAVVLVSALLGRYGARTLALACLAIAGFLAPMNALRLAPAITLTDIFLVASGGLAVMARTRSDRRRPDAMQEPDRRSIRPDVLAAVLLIGGGLVGSQFAVDLGSSLSAIIRFGLAAVGVPLVFIGVAPSRAELRALGWSFLLGASANAVIGVVAYNLSTRGIGLSTHSNHLAVGCMLASGVAAGLYLTSERRAGFLAAACWAVVTVGILKSGSRAGVLGAAIVIVVVLAFTGSTRILRWCVLVVVGVGTMLHFNVIPYDERDAIARLLGRDPTVEISDYERGTYRDEAVESIRQHPLTGAGFEDARQAHNVYLQVWGAAGIIGLLGFAVLWNAAIRGVLEGASDDRWLLGAAAAALSFLVVAVASNVLWDRYLWYAFAVFLTGRTQRNLLLRAEPTAAVPEPAKPARVPVAARTAAYPRR